MHGMVYVIICSQGDGKVRKITLQWLLYSCHIVYMHIRFVCIVKLQCIIATIIHCEHVMMLKLALSHSL